jgi:hypothetical protein
MKKYAIVSADKGIYLGSGPDIDFWSKQDDSDSERAPVFSTMEEARAHAEALGAEGAWAKYAFVPVDVGSRASYASPEQLFDAGLRSQLGYLVHCIREKYMWQKSPCGYRQPLAPVTAEEFLKGNTHDVIVEDEGETWYMTAMGPTFGGRSYERLHEAIEAGQRKVDASYEDMDSGIAESLGFDAEHWHLFIVGDKISVISKDDSRVSANCCTDRWFEWTITFDNGGAEDEICLDTGYDVIDALEKAECVVANLAEGYDAASLQL